MEALGPGSKHCTYVALSIGAANGENGDWIAGLKMLRRDAYVSVSENNTGGLLKP